MRFVVGFLAMLVPAIVFADQSAENIDEYIASTGQTKERWRVLFLAECMGALNLELQALFYAEREGGVMPEFSATWCIQNKIIPSDGKGNKRS